MPSADACRRAGSRDRHCTCSIVFSVLEQLSIPTLPSRLTLEQLLRFDGELHRQLVEDLLAEAVDDHRDRVLLVMPRWRQ